MCRRRWRFRKWLILIPFGQNWASMISFLRSLGIPSLNELTSLFLVSIFSQKQVSGTFLILENTEYLWFQCRLQDQIQIANVIYGPLAVPHLGSSPLWPVVLCFFFPISINNSGPFFPIILAGVEVRVITTGYYCHLHCY